MMLLNFNDSLKNEDQLIRTKTETRKIKRNEKKMEKKMKMREKKKRKKKNQSPKDRIWSTVPADLLQC